jgi:hypothetical protein
MITLILGALIVILSFIFRDKTTNRPPAFIFFGGGLIVGSILALLFLP